MDVFAHKNMSRPSVGGRGGAAPASGQRMHRVMLIAFLLIAAALRMYDFRGFGAVDDAEYAKFAYQMSQDTFSVGTYDGPAVFPLRVGIIYPTAVLFRLFGVHEWTMVLYPFILSLMGVALASVCAGHFFGTRAALIAAALWAVLPLENFHATILVPDGPAAFFASAAVVAILLLARSGIHKRWLLFSGGLAAGLAFGISWLSKESVVYLVPFCAILFSMTVRDSWKKNSVIWAGVALGALTVLFSELFIYHRITGDWLYRLHETERNYVQNRTAFFDANGMVPEIDGVSHLKALAKRLFLTGPMTIFMSSQFLYLPLVGLLASAHALFWKDRSYLIPALWMLSLVLMYNLSSGSLSAYVPLVLFERYLYPVMLPAVVLVSGLLGDLFRRENNDQGKEIRKERLFWGVLLAVALGVVGIQKNYQVATFYPGWVEEVKRMSAVLKPSDRVYADILSVKGLEFFWRYPETMQVTNFEDLASSSRIPSGSYVLLNQRYLNWLSNKAGWWPTKSRAYRKPEFSDPVPSAWTRVWRNGNAALYRVD